MASNADPFDVAKDALGLNLDYLKDRASQYVDSVAKVNTAADRDFRELKATLARDVRSAESQLRDLKRTVDLVERERAQFSHVTDAELADRRAFCKSAKKTVNSIKADMDSDKVLEKLKTDEAMETQKYRPTDTYGASSEMEMSNTNFINDKEAQARMQMLRQEEDLSELGVHVDRVGQLGQVINTELKEQNAMLELVEEDMDDANEKMGVVMGKLSKLLKTKDRCQIFSIIILLVILAILFFLVIYT